MTPSHFFTAGRIRLHVRQRGVHAACFLMLYLFPIFATIFTAGGHLAYHATERITRVVREAQERQREEWVRAYGHQHRLGEPYHTHGGPIGFALRVTRDDSDRSDQTPPPLVSSQLDKHFAGLTAAFTPEPIAPVKAPRHPNRFTANFDALPDDPPPRA